NAQRSNLDIVYQDAKQYAAEEERMQQTLLGSSQVGRRGCLVRHWMRSGSSRKLPAAPAANNETTATTDGSCRSARPKMPCPDVHPPAYAVPKPMRKPPPTTMSTPRTLSSTGHVKISRGTRPEKSWIPSAAREACAWEVMATGCGLRSSTPPTKPPPTTPARK